MSSEFSLFIIFLTLFSISGWCWWRRWWCGGPPWWLVCGPGSSNGRWLISGVWRMEWGSVPGGSPTLSTVLPTKAEVVVRLVSCLPSLPVRLEGVLSDPVLLGDGDTCLVSQYLDRGGDFILRCLFRGDSIIWSSPKINISWLPSSWPSNLLISFLTLDPPVPGGFSFLILLLCWIKIFEACI